MGDSGSLGLLPATSVERLRAHRGRFVVGLSGGMDSVVLLDALCSLALPRLHAVHVNHQLQPMAEAFENVCKRITEQYDVPLSLMTVSITRSGSLEDAARSARYQAFDEVMNDEDLLLLAHHREDQVETLLLSVLRGQQPTGGMPQERQLPKGRLFRPLLSVPQASIHDYAQHRGLSWVEDPSNSDTLFDRNFLRHEIMPLLADRFENASARMFGVVQRLADREQLLRSYASRDLDNVRAPIGLDIEAMLTMPLHHRREVIRCYIDQLSLPQPGDGALHEILGLHSVRPDAEPAVRWQNVVCRRHRGALMITGVVPTPIPPTRWISGESVPAEVRGLSANDLIEGQGLRESEGHRAISLCHGIEGELRCRRPGDRLTDGRLLKDVLVAAGVPHWIRDVMPLFCTDAGIVAIPALPDYGTSMVVARDAMTTPGGHTEHGSASLLAVNWPGQPYSD
ncbi:MAG: tRNA lysidine(34) synthetase TilS [Pseudomonadota bacterium]